MTRLLRLNWIGGITGWVWLLVAMLPIYWIVISSFKSQSNFFATNPLLPRTPGRWTATGSSSKATSSATSATAWFLRLSNSLFLMGLAIPLQAVIIPVYLIIIRLRLYDTLTAMILPSIAFAISLSVLSNFIRDVPRELFESMRLDGCSEWGTLWRLAFPLTRPALVTVTIYNALLVWNNFLLPLILTQSPDKRTLPLALWTFQGQYSVNIPAVLASVVLTTLPILIFYAIGRRQLLSGLTAGFSK